MVDEEDCCCEREGGRATEAPAAGPRGRLLGPCPRLPYSSLPVLVLRVWRPSNNELGPGSPPGVGEVGAGNDGGRPPNVKALVS